MPKKSNIVQVEIKYTFTEEERNKLGPLIAKLTQDAQDKRNEKKAADAVFNSEIKAIETEFNENVVRLNNGWESRHVAAKKYKNYATGQWEYYGMNFELLKTEPFESYDYQVDVDHANETEAPKFTELDEETPSAEGTEVTNPALYERCLRELNYYRGQMALISTIEDEDEQISQGLAVANKIQALEKTLIEMQVNPVPNPEAHAEPEAEASDLDESEEVDQKRDTEEQQADEVPDLDTQKGLNQQAKDLGDDPLFPDAGLPDQPNPEAEGEKPKYPNRFKAGSQPWNKGRLTTQGEDGTPSPRKDEEPEESEPTE